MKQLFKQKKVFLGMMSMALLLILAGFLLISRVFDKYDTLVRENLDNQLLRLTKAVDRSVESYLGRYADNLVHTTNHQDIAEAEKLWNETGQEMIWSSKIKASLLGPKEGFADVLLMDATREKVLLSTTKNKDYIFPEQESTVSDIEIRPCLDSSGTVYLAFVKDTARGVSYAALVNLKDFYEEIAGDLTVPGENQIMLMDRYGQMFIHKKNENVHIHRISDMVPGDCEYEALQYMKNQEYQDNYGTYAYTAVSNQTGKEYSARMVVLPVEGEGNGYFTVGVLVDFAREIMPLKSTIVLLVLAGFLLVLGITLLLILLAETMRKSQKTLQEIEVLQEKNRAMEELNRKTQKLAHHQRLEMMGMLTSGIAHEFNNLLTPIMGYSMMILEKLPEDDTELYDEILEIYHMSAKAKTVISRLSDLSRKNASTVFKSISVDELVRRMISAAKSARPNGVDVQLELKCPEICMMGNETQLSQMLLNLILNSYHALEENGGTLEVITEADEQMIHLTIKDNGCGISEENMKHIFEPFFTTKENGKGTGLGMAIVAQVVEDHHGKIKVQSVERQGTIIRVSFPVSQEKMDKS